MKCSSPQWHLLNRQGTQAHNAAHTLRPHFTGFPNPDIWFVRLAFHFFQCKLNTIHNYSAKPLTPTDTASRLAESCLPKDNLRGSGTPQSLALGVPRAGGGEFGLAGSWSFGGGYIPRTEIIPGKNKTTETQCSQPHDVGWVILTWPLRPSLTMHPCVPGSDYPHVGRPGILLSHNAGDTSWYLREASP